MSLIYVAKCIHDRIPFDMCLEIDYSESDQRWHVVLSDLFVGEGFTKKELESIPDDIIESYRKDIETIYNNWETTTNARCVDEALIYEDVYNVSICDKSE